MAALRYVGGAYVWRRGNAIETVYTTVLTPDTDAGSWSGLPF